MPNGEKTVPGNVSFTAYANVQEDYADVKAVIVTGSVEVQRINNGVNVVSQNFNGNESELATKAYAIELTGEGGLSVSLNDSDGSESYGAILLSDVPNGFWFMSEIMRIPQRLQVMQVVMAQPTLGYSQKVVDYQLMLRYYRRYTGVVLLKTYSWL